MKNNHAVRSRSLAAATAITVLGLAAGAVAAAEPQAPVAAGTSNGVRAYIDPETGKLRQPTQDELAAEAAQAATADAAAPSDGKSVSYATRADGTRRALDTEGRLMESVLATVKPDGTISYQFVAGDGSNPHEAPAVLEEK